MFNIEMVTVTKAELSRDETELSLSDVQLEIFDGWRRPGEALSPTKVRLSNVSAGAAPTMTAENDIDLIQDVTTDCSVVASLCAGIARASRGHSKVHPTRELDPFVSNEILDYFINFLPL